MKKLIALILVFSLLALSGNLYTKERRGADLVVQKRDGKEIRGELIAVKENMLLLKDSESGADVSVDISDIKVIKVEKESKAWKGVLYGSFISGFIGAIYLGTRCQVHNPICRAYALWGGAIGAVAGALIGGLIGASVETDKIIQIEGKSDSEINKALEELRKKARIRDYQ